VTRLFSICRQQLITVRAARNAKRIDARVRGTTKIPRNGQDMPYGTGTEVAERPPPQVTAFKAKIVIF
jgi:hypothetical protein